MKLIKVVKYGGSLFTKKGLKPPNLSDILDRYTTYVRLDVIRRAAVETINALREYEKRGVSFTNYGVSGLFRSNKERMAKPI